MDSDRIASWLSLIANFGVLIGIALLILELSQNREAIQAQTRTELSNSVVELLTANMGDSQYADILHRGNMGEPLTEVEKYQYWRHRSAFLEYHENLFYQYQLGLFEDYEFRRQAAVIRNDIIQFPGLGKVWCEQRDRMSPELVAAILAESDGHLCNSD